MEPLTKKQEKAFLFIRTTTETRFSTPTLRELCEYMGYKSIGSAQDVVATLRRKGYLIQKDTHKARALHITPEGKKYGRPDDDLVSDGSTLAVPCLGKVPAGNPIEAIEERVGVLRVSYSTLGLDKRSLRSRKLYAVKADGESMVGAGILDGDWLVVRSQKTADPGEIVVALFDGEATVKRLEKDRKGWFLKPENPDFSPIYASDGQLEVIGKVIALQRTVH
jgi:repressor LexA